LKNKIFLGLILLLGFLLRWIHLLTPTVDSDQAAFGLMAMHMMKGEFPIIQWGFPYMATGESLFAVPFFFFLGPSAFSLNLSVAVQSLIFIYLIYVAGKRMFSEKAGLLAALFAALGPSYLIVHCVLARGAYIETLIFGTLSFLYAVKILFPAKAGDEKVLNYFLLGMFVGIGLWFHFLIVFFAFPIAICFLLKPKRLFCGKIFMALTGFLIGSSPFWIYNAFHHFESLKFVFSHQEKLHTFSEGLRSILLTGFPVVWGVLENGSKAFYSLLSFLPALFWGILGLFSVKTVIQEVWKERKISPLFLVLSFLIFYVLILNHSQFVESDTRRYYIPAYAGFILVWAFAMDRLLKRSVLWGSIILACFIGSHLWTNYADATYFHPKPLGKYRRMLERENKLFDLLKEKGLTEIYYRDYWMGFRLNFTSQEKITFVQSRSERYAPYAAKLERAENPAWILKDGSLLEDLKRIGGVCHVDRFSRWWIYSHFQEPSFEYREILPDEMKASASHQKNRVTAFFDRNASTVWSTQIPQNKDMWMELDLGKERNLGLIRFWNPDYLMHNYPMKVSVEISLDGQSWNTALGPVKCDYYYWSGPRLYDWDVHYRWELRLPAVKARWIRIRQNSEDKANPWMIGEAFIYEIAGEKIKDDPEEADLFEEISKLKLNKIYAERYLNILIKEKFHGQVETLEPDTRSVFDIADRHPRIVFENRTGFVLEISDAASFERIMEAKGIALQKMNFGRWTLFWLQDGAGEAQRYNDELEFVWLGFSAVPVPSRDKSQCLYEKGMKAEQAGLWEDAASFYEKSLRLYPNHQEARRQWIDVLRQLNRSEKADEEQMILDKNTRPEIKAFAKFENGVEFLGYTLSEKDMRPGEMRKMTFFWKLSREIKDATGVFVHFEREKIYFQADHNFLSDDGRRVVPLPEGEIFKQERDIACPGNISSGRYDMRIGLFDLKSGKRWKILKSDQDHADHRLKAGTVFVQ
jgi:hypothetical protein